MAAPINSKLAELSRSAIAVTDPQLEWRRYWKPDLSAQPWRPLHSPPQRALVKCLVARDCYEILVYDADIVWYEECGRNTIEQRSEKLNPNVEVPLSTLLQHLKDNLSSPKKSTTYSMEPARARGRNGMILRLASQLTDGVPFTWDFCCQEAPQSTYALHLATPLLTMVSELCRREEELQKLLRRKDAEIEDYKAAGGKVSRKHLSTTPFDAKAFNNDMNSSKGFESQVQSSGSLAFLGQGQELYRNVMMTNAWLNRPQKQAIANKEVTADMSVEAGQTAGATGPSWADRLPPSVAGLVQSPTATASSPTKSLTPKSSPIKGMGSPEPSDKDIELMRRQALEKRLADEKEKYQHQAKKRNKKIF